MLCYKRVLLWFYPSITKFVFITFDKEHVHNTVEIDIFGLCIHRHGFASPPPHEKLFRTNDVISIDHVLVSSGSWVSRFCSRVGELACCGGILRVDKLYSIVLMSVMFYVHEHIYVKYLPGGRSVWEKTVMEVLSTCTVFSHTDRTSSVNNIFIFFTIISSF